MSSKIGQRRAAKAQRRKKLLAERRNGVHAAKRSSQTENIRRAASTPLHACLVHDGLFERGNGMLILTRRSGIGRLAMSVFLLDVYCLGIKDAFFRQADEAEFDDIVSALKQEAPFSAVDPSYARKLLRDLAAYARSFGFEPAAGFATAELLFGDVRADACDADFRFGHEGKPLYIPGPTDTPAQMRQRMKQLTRRLGEGAIDVLPPFDEDDDFEDEDMPVYDPAVAPDPAEWLALDEDERLSLVRDYHQRAGISVPNETVHAVFHAVVENQIALGDELPVRRTIRRLMDEGLDRHEAIHAVGSVLSGHLADLMQGKQPAGTEVQAAYDAAVERLTAEGWRAMYEDDGAR